MARVLLCFLVRDREMHDRAKTVAAETHLPMANEGVMGHQRSHAGTDKQSTTKRSPLQGGTSESDDVAQGYSQDSGYPQSGGYDRDPADASGSQSSDLRRETSDEETHENSQIRTHASDELNAAPYAPAPSSDRAKAPSDGTIRAALHELLVGRASPRGVIVTVESGNVTIEGEVADSAEKSELGEIVRTTPGVRRVTNRLVARRLRH